MNLPSTTTDSSPVSKTSSVSKKRWMAALLLCAILWLAATVASQFLPQVLLNLPLVGITFALVGVLQLLLAPVAIGVGLSIVRLQFREIGLTTAEWQREALLGLAVAAVFAALQFLIIIPNTGGATRSDIVANSAQIGDSIGGVVGFLVLAWAGAFSEELFFRGYFVTTLRHLFGNTRLALTAITILTTALFALGHGYQGWAGVIDTGIYGGLILTLLFLWRGRLTAPIVAHAMWNTYPTLARYFLY
ncbi:MAG: CPBP family intramembrane metalloprotease [Anaerolineales bacterium]|nr:CPBP family intramembrane metalloprotease [Anaerolineales bacterium]